MDFLIQRAFTGILVLLCVSVLAFTLVLVSGDPTLMMLPDDATPKQREELRRHYGFDRPIYVQYAMYLGRAVQGDFGKSIRYGVPNTSLVLERIPATLRLMAVAFGLALGVGIPLGIVAGLKERSVWDVLASLLAVLGQAAPTFFIGIVLILVVAVSLRWLPAGGSEGVPHLILPGITLGAAMLAQTTRMLRSSLLEVMEEDYIRTARSKGLTERWVVARHGLKNAAIPVLTLLGMQMGVALGGAVVTEQVFAYRGLGLLGIQAILHRDVPLVVAWINFVATGIVLMNFLVDVSYTLLDPRTRLR